MFETDIFYDSDCLSCFLAVRECGILQKLFSKIIVPAVVAHEILKKGTPQHIKDNFNDLVELDFVEVRGMEVGSLNMTFSMTLKEIMNSWEMVKLQLLL